MVQKKRHIAKAFTWRIIASLTTFTIGWLATGDITTGLSIGAFDFILKLVLYYVHERIWYRSKFGVGEDDNTKKWFSKFLRKEGKSDKFTITITNPKFGGEYEVKTCNDPTNSEILAENDTMNDYTFVGGGALRAYVGIHGKYFMFMKNGTNVQLNEEDIKFNRP